MDARGNRRRRRRPLPLFSTPVAIGIFVILQMPLLLYLHGDIGRHDDALRSPSRPHVFTSSFLGRGRESSSGGIDSISSGGGTKRAAPDDDRCGGDRAAYALPFLLEGDNDDESSFSADDERPPWCLDVPAPPSTTPVYLASVAYVRIWPAEDLARLSFADLAHWLTYYRYMGVERVYLYDTHHDEGECVLNDPHVKAGVDSGYVHYVNWQNVELANLQPDGTRKEKHPRAVQGTAYAHVQSNFGKEVRWMTFTDMDEYPYRSEDVTPGFLARYLLHQEQREEKESDAKSKGTEGKKGGQCDRTTQFMMPNVLLEGGRGDLTKGPMLIQQVTRLGKRPANHLVKQIVRLDAASRHAVHGSTTSFGRTTRWTMEEVTMKHVHGGRRWNWKRIDELSEVERTKLFEETVENDNGGIDEQVLRCF